MGGRHSLSDVAFNLNNINQQNERAVLQGELERFVKETGELPANLQELSRYPGYEAVRSILNNNQNFEFRIVGTFNAGGYRYSRGLLVDTVRQSSGSNPWNVNDCGSGSADLYWCANDEYIASVDTRETSLITQKLAAQQANELFYRLAALVTYTLDVPKERSNGSILSAGSAAALSTYVGQSGGLSGCNGSFAFEGIALSCKDLYDPQGNPIFYNYFGDRGFGVVATLDELQANGQPILIYKAAFL